MILVIDTNVFISGFISESYPWRILDYFLDKRFTLALDDRIYLEYSAIFYCIFRGNKPGFVIILTERSISKSGQ